MVASAWDNFTFSPSFSSDKFKLKKKRDTNYFKTTTKERWWLVTKCWGRLTFRLGSFWSLFCNKPTRSKRRHCLLSEGLSRDFASTSASTLASAGWGEKTRSVSDNRTRRIGRELRSYPCMSSSSCAHCFFKSFWSFWTERSRSRRRLWALRTSCSSFT